MIISQLDHNTTDSRVKNGSVTQNSFSPDGFSLYGELVKLSEEKMFFFKPTPLVDYKKCVLSEGVDWVIVYYVRDPDTGKLRRMRIKINSIKSIRERRKVAREMMAAIDQKLVLGWNPLTKERAPMAFTTLYEAYIPDWTIQW